MFRNKNPLIGTTFVRGKRSSSRNKFTAKVQLDKALRVRAVSCRAVPCRAVPCRAVSEICKVITGIQKQ